MDPERRHYTRRDILRAVGAGALGGALAWEGIRQAAKYLEDTAATVNSAIGITACTIGQDATPTVNDINCLLQAVNQPTVGSLPASANSMQTTRTVFAEPTATK